MYSLSAVGMNFFFFSSSPYAVEPHFMVRRLLVLEGYLFALDFVGFVLKSDVVK